MTSKDPTFQRPPLYAVVFKSTSNADSYEPVVARPDVPDPTVTVPHGFDRDIAALLSALWYCLHLPNTFYELVDIPPLEMKAAQLLHLDHHILLAPISVFDTKHVKEWFVARSAALVICPDDLLDEAALRSEELGFALPPTALSQLSDQSLKAHWRALHQHFVPEARYLGREPTLTHRLDLASVDLPRRWLVRQFGADNETQPQARTSLAGAVAEALKCQVILAATARLDQENRLPDEAAELMPQTMEEERDRLQVPVALALPGVAPAYIRDVYGRAVRDRIVAFNETDSTDTWSREMGGRSDVLIERAAIEFVTTHQALARGGVGLMLPTIPGEAFVLLAQLERHFEQRRQSGPVVWRMLERLDALTQPMWSDAAVATIARASALTVFSNFPVGLLRFPGDTAPLSARVPIAYRPLLPLTRTVQKEIAYVPPIELTSGLRVLVCECISVDDRIGPASRGGWEFAAEHVNSERPRIAMQIAETQTVQALREAIAVHKPHVLVISAHGVLSRERNVAGLQVGKEFLLGPGIGPLPPVVILSACSVAPRGSGTVTVTDLLLREGAVAVLGTQVPVDVTHNAMLMMRFLLYITEVLTDRESHSTLLEVWHRVQTSNAVNDVLSGSPSLRTWGFESSADRVPVIQEFMGVQSVGRLRRGHIYADTEQVLAEIAEAQGMGERVRNWFRRPGYVPESLFYVFAGRPDRIYLQPLLETVRSAASRT